MVKKNIIVCVSGSGRSLENLIKCEDEYSYHVSGVVSSSKTCKAIEIAKAYNLPLLTIGFPLDTASKEFEVCAGSLKDFFKEYKADLIVLAGFLRPFPLSSCEEKLKVINIHPSLLPKFGGKGMYGKKVHKAVIESNETHSGASVHFVTEVYDEGKVIAQVKVERKKDDTAESLAQRVFEGEKKLLPKAANMVLKKELTIESENILTITL